MCFREETSEEVLSPLIAKLETILRSDCDVVEDLSKQVEGYELLVKQLKVYKQLPITPLCLNFMPYWTFAYGLS